MKSVSLMFLAALLVFPPLTALRAQEKPRAALGRVSSLGEISEGQKRIIITRLESLLSESYILISQEQYRKAEEAAFAELDLAKCTEAECIRKIQEILQVERLFILQIIREAEITQLSLNLVKMDSKRVVEAVCDQCSITNLYEQIDTLASQLITEDIRDSAQEMIAGQPAGEAAEPPAEEEGGFPLWGWLLIGLAAAGLAVAASGSSGSSPSDGGVVGFEF